jgi:hypothetical protein
LKGSDRKITYGEAVQLTNLDELKARFIDEEVDTAMRSSHEEQFRYLEKLANSDKLREEVGTWSGLVELIERRNVFAHSGGVTSRQYLAVCKRNGVNTGGSKEGDPLRTDTAYYDKACDIIIETAVKIAQTVCRRLFPGELEAADSFLTDDGVKFLREERWTLALTLFDYAAGLPLKYVSDDASRRISLINKCIALKALGKKDLALDALQLLDWSAADEKFKLAVAVIRDEYDKAEESMYKAGKAEAVSETSFIEWPLFRDFRNTEQFRRAFQKLFGKDYRISAADVAQERVEELEEALQRSR